MGKDPLERPRGVFTDSESFSKASFTRKDIAEAVKKTLRDFLKGLFLYVIDSPQWSVCAYLLRSKL